MSPGQYKYLVIFRYMLIYLIYWHGVFWLSEWNCSVLICKGAYFQIRIQRWIFP